MTYSLCIFVFSFNRGIFLENCISSIEQCAPGVKTVIIDDNSTDPDAIEKLGSLSEKYQVIRSFTEQAEMKTGGLYGNMNHAIKLACEWGYSYSIFIQDDMQLVRQIKKNDIVRIDDYFERVPNSIQVSTTFIRTLSATDFLDEHFINQKAHAYIRHTNKEKGKSNFSASGVFHVERFHNIFGSFEVGEGINSEKARKLGLICGRAIYPFMCWLPYPESYRGKRKDMKHKFFEYFGHSGYYPIECMADESVTEFLNRDPHILPIMEHYLSAPTAPRADVWSTGGGEYNFVCYGGILALFFKEIRSIKHRLQASDS